jgi:hypothetical protein
VSRLLVLRPGKAGGPQVGGPPGEFESEYSISTAKADLGIAREGEWPWLLAFALAVLARHGSLWGGLLIFLLGRRN